MRYFLVKEGFANLEKISIEVCRVSLLAQVDVSEVKREHGKLVNLPPQQRTMQNCNIRSEFKAKF